MDMIMLHVCLRETNMYEEKLLSFKQYTCKYARKLGMKKENLGLDIKI